MMKWCLMKNQEFLLSMIDNCVINREEPSLNVLIHWQIELLEHEMLGMLETQDVAVF
jgi:hypothetical protein